MPLLGAAWQPAVPRPSPQTPAACAWCDRSLASGPHCTGICALFCHRNQPQTPGQSGSNLHPSPPKRSPVQELAVTLVTHSVRTAWASHLARSSACDATKHYVPRPRMTPSAARVRHNISASEQHCEYCTTLCCAGKRHPAEHCPRTEDAAERVAARPCEHLRQSPASSCRTSTGCSPRRQP